MSDSNIGARKKKNIRNHIFVVNGIINSAVNRECDPVDAVILDIKQCFDAEWMEDCVNDLYESGVTGRNLAIIHEENLSCEIKVNTGVGETETATLERIEIQGSVWSPLKCSNSVDTIGKECLLEEKFLYLYKENVSPGHPGVKIPPFLTFKKKKIKKITKCSKLPKTQNKLIKVVFNFRRGWSELRKISTDS